MFNLTINDKSYKVDAPDEMPLLWVLRDLLGLKGTKFGCGKGLCGSCTVHIDGVPSRACSIPASSVSEKSILTIEGLSEEGDHPVQKAWQKLNIPQCGYCQSGQIMSAVALITDKKTPTDDDIDEAMSGNICRCGTYVRIKEAIKLAAKES